MSDSGVDAFSADGQAVASVASPTHVSEICEGCKAEISNTQSQEEVTRVASSSVTCPALPPWPVNFSVPSIDLFGSLRQYAQIRDFPSFQSAMREFPTVDHSVPSPSGLISQLGSSAASLIPELEMAANGSEMNQLNVKTPDVPEGRVAATVTEALYFPEIQKVSFDSTVEQEEGIPERGVPIFNEITSAEDFYIPNIEESSGIQLKKPIPPEQSQESARDSSVDMVPQKKPIDLLPLPSHRLELCAPPAQSKESAGDSSVDMVPQKNPKDLLPLPSHRLELCAPPAQSKEPAGDSSVDMVPQRKPIEIHPLVLHRQELDIPKFLNPNPLSNVGFFGSLIGKKRILSSNVSHSFGDRRMGQLNHLKYLEGKQKTSEAMDAVKQKTSVALKALVLSIKMSRNTESLFLDELYQSKEDRLERIRNSLTYSRVFKQDIFLVSSTAKKSEHKNLQCCGEPVIVDSCIIPICNAPQEPHLYRLDVCEGLTPKALSVSKDLIFSEYGSDKSFTKGVELSLRKVTPIMDVRVIERKGIRLFSHQARLVCFDDLKEWKRQDEGNIEIWEHREIYVILRDRIDDHLLLHMRVNEQWKIEHPSHKPKSCLWTHFNHAACREGILEYITCNFRQPSHAAEFVARIRNFSMRSNLR